MVYHPDLGYAENGLDFTDASLYKTATRAFGKATILPSFSYQSKIFSDLEDEKIWTRNWIAIGTTHQIPNVGDLLPFTVGRHGLHVQRQEDGSLIGRFNKAQHGGCRAIPVQCQTGKKTKCSFTSCGYSRDRKAIQVEEIGENTPTMHQYLGLIPERLLPVKVETLGPFIFVNLEAESKSILDEHASLANNIDIGSIENLELIFDQWFECQSNWKISGRAFYDSTNASKNISVKENPTNTNYFCAENVHIPELADDQSATNSKEKIDWLFPNLLIVTTSTNIISVILQPTSMSESLLRVCAFNKDGNHKEKYSSPESISNFIKTIQSNAKSYQQFAEQISAKNNSGITETVTPFENNFAGYVFQKYVAKTITTEHKYYWNAPLYTINPVA
jgi:hypothetical protein